jgi:hypothetical protein
MSTITLDALASATRTEPTRAAAARRYRAKVDAGARHNEPRNLNVFVRDVESHVTDYGRHNRLVASQTVGDYAHVEVREDIIPGRPLAASTDEDRRRVIRRDGWAPGSRLVYEGAGEPWTNGLGYTCVEHTYRIVRRNA